MVLIRDSDVIDTEVFIFQCFRKAVTKFILSFVIILIKCLEKLDFVRKTPNGFPFGIHRTDV